MGQDIKEMIKTIEDNIKLIMEQDRKTILNSQLAFVTIIQTATEQNNRR